MTNFGPIALRSLPLVAFLMVVCIGLIALIAWPPAAKSLGPWVCATGETMVDVQTPYSRPGESGIAIEYFCEGPMGSREVDVGDILPPAVVAYIAFFLLAVWPFVTFLRYRSATRLEYMQREGIAATVRILSVAQTSMRINRMPVLKLELDVQPQGLPGFRKNLRKAIPQVLIPHILPGREFSGLVDPRQPTKVVFQLSELAQQAVESPESFGDSEGALDALRALKQMREEGLISADEYSAKKSEIMERM